MLYFCSIVAVFSLGLQCVRAAEATHYRRLEFSLAHETLYNRGDMVRSRKFKTSSSIGAGLKTACITAFVTAGLCVIFAGCAGQSKMGKLQQAASDLNTATRFGRMDVASELVAPKDLQPFAIRHAAWGNAVRIVDLEHQSIQLAGENEAVVHVVVGWQHPDDAILRVTQLAQRWSFDRGGWRLNGEQRVAGDVGLIGEPVEQVAPKTHENVYWPSSTIR